MKSFWAIHVSRVATMASLAVLGVAAAGCGGTEGGGDLELELPDIAGSAAIVVAPDRDLIIGSKNPDARRKPASTTKMIASLLAARAIDEGRTSRDAMLTVSAEALEGTPGTFVMGLEEGDRVSLEDLFHGMLLPSTNDSTRVIAEHVGGTVEGFVAMMNDEVAALGLENTNFLNPTGAPADCFVDEMSVPTCDHYSTARDLAKIAAIFRAHPFIGAVIAKTEHTTTTWVNSTGEPQDRTLCTTNHLLPSSDNCDNQFTYEGADGVKTGTTRQLRGIAIASAVRNGERMLVVVLDSNFAFAEVQNRFSDAVTLLDFGFDR